MLGILLGGTGCGSRFTSRITRVAITGSTSQEASRLVGTWTSAVLPLRIGCSRANAFLHFLQLFERSSSLTKSAIILGSLQSRRSPRVRFAFYRAIGELSFGTFCAPASKS